MVTLHATLVPTGGSTTGIPVPEDVVLGFDRGRRVAVVATINGYAFRNTIAAYRGEFWLGVSRENREGAHIEAGEPVDVELVVDDAPRTVEVPPDLAAALAAAGPGLTDAWARLSYSRQRAHVLAVEGAKTAATRERRVAAALAALG